MRHARPSPLPFLDLDPGRQDPSNERTDRAGSLGWWTGIPCSCHALLSSGTGTCSPAPRIPRAALTQTKVERLDDDAEVVSHWAKLQGGGLNALLWAGLAWEGNKQCGEEMDAMISRLRDDGNRRGSQEVPRGERRSRCRWTLGIETAARDKRTRRITGHTGSVGEGQDQGSSRQRLTMNMRFELDIQGGRVTWQRTLWQMGAVLYCVKRGPRWSAVVGVAVIVIGCVGCVVRVERKRG